MNKKLLVSAVLASYVAMIGTVSAQDHRDDHDNHDNHGQNERRDAPGPESRNDRNDYHPGDNHGHNGERGAGPRHDMHKGDHLAPEYRGNEYVVSDWRGHHLSAPPRGYHWVNAGGDYVLVAVASGVIADLLLSH